MCDLRARLLWVCVIVWLSFPGSITCGQTDRTKTANFEVHEWGVFTAPRDALWLKQDMVAEWSSFPDFFHGVWPKTHLSYRGPVTKPVIYFHSKEKLDIQFEIQFAAGRPLIWWPPAEYPNSGAPWVRSLSGDKTIDPNSFLVFQIRLNDGLGKQREVAKDHWLNQLRKVKSASVMTYGSHTNLRQHYETREQESFVYYDGLMKPPNPPVVTRIEEGIQLQTVSDHDWLDVVVIEREGDSLLISSSSLPKIAAGKNKTRVKLQQSKALSITSIKSQLQKNMIAAGLHEDETQSLLDVWGQGLFQRQGLTVIYRVDQTTYDKWLPIISIPKPKKTVRTGLVVHYHLEPELPAKIERLVKRLASIDYRTRNDADRELREIGGPAFRLIQKAAADASPEVKLRCQKILRLRELEKKAIEMAKKYKRQGSK